MYDSPFPHIEWKPLSMSQRRVDFDNPLYSPPVTLCIRFNTVHSEKTYRNLNASNNHVLVHNTVTLISRVSCDI